MEENSSKESVGDSEDLKMIDDDILAYGRKNLHPTLLENLLKQYKTFSKVQRQVIPSILSGKDVLVKSQTGSGKTLAALIPILSSTLHNYAHDSDSSLIILIVVPTTELVEQIQRVVAGLLKDTAITCKAMLSAEFPTSNIVITKPAHALGICDSLSKLQYLIVDEADLLFEFGYKKETMKFAEALRLKCTPKRFQAVLLSATMDKEVEELANMLLYKPEYIEVARDSDMGTIKEYYIEVPENEKPLMLYTLIKMETLPSSRIIFVNSNQKGYFLYCLLRKLYIDSNVLSKLLSPKLRMSIIQSFNQGMIDTLIVVDTEETLSRGIDFKSVKCVINYDEPESIDSYIHRIGRGGRLTDSVAILMCNEAGSLKEKTDDSTTPLESIFSTRSLEKLGIGTSSLVPLKYRIEDASKVVTPKLIEIAKMQAVRQSALHEDEFIAKVTNRDAQMLKTVLKTDNELLKADKRHLDYIPKYIMDDGLKKDVEGVRRVTGVKKSDFVKKQKKSSKPKKTRKKFTKKSLPHFKRKKK